MPRLVEKGLSELEYDTMLAALSGTSKGRAFLAEYVHRTRPSEIRSLLSAMSQLAGTIATLKADIRPGRLASELTRIAAQMPNGPERHELMMLAASMQDGPAFGRAPESPERLLAQLAPLRNLTEEPTAAWTPQPARNDAATEVASAGVASADTASANAAPEEPENAPAAPGAGEPDVMKTDSGSAEEADPERSAP